MPYQQVTLAQLRGLLDNQLGNAATTFWRVAEKNFIINEALRVYNAMTGYWTQPVTLGTNGKTIADQTWYSIPSGTVTSGMRVTFNNQPLVPCSLFSLDNAQPNWESENTSSGGDAPQTVTSWGIGALNLIAIWPADHDGGNSLICEGVAITPVLTADSDFLNLGEHELSQLLDYMQHAAVFKEGGQEFQATLPLYQSFVADCGKSNAMLMASQKFRKWMGMDKGRDQVKRFSSVERVGAR